MTERLIKFIAADMDGTLLDQYGQLDPQMFELIDQLEQQGIRFCAASGRQYFSLKDTFAPVADKVVFVAENGTLVMHQGKELYSCTMPKDDIVAIINCVRTIPGATIVLCGKRSAYIETQDPQALDELQKYYHQCQYVPNVLEVEDDFIKVAVCHFGGTEQLVYPSVSHHFGHSHQVVVSASIWLDVMNANASKGAAIEHLQQHFEFEAQHTMSFGDYLNDLEMLAVSEHSYAMANAHERVKRVARFEAPSNRDAGVQRVIGQLLTEMK